MADPVMKLRKKTRFIAEARYFVTPAFFDNRGKYIQTIHPQIKDRLGHWSSTPTNILFGESAEQPVNQFFLSPQRISVALEDPSSVEDFATFAMKCFGLAYDSFEGTVKKIDRLGIRFVEVLEAPKSEDYEATLKRILERFHKIPFDLPLTYKDTMARLIHEHGSFSIGPARKGEAWIETQFGAPEENVPDVGIAVDIDSTHLHLEMRSKQDLLQCFRSVLGLTRSVEEALARGAGLLDG